MNRKITSKSNRNINLHEKSLNQFRKIVIKGKSSRLNSRKLCRMRSLSRGKEVTFGIISFPFFVFLSISARMKSRIPFVPRDLRRENSGIAFKREKGQVQGGEWARRGGNKERRSCQEAKWVKFVQRFELMIINILWVWALFSRFWAGFWVVWRGKRVYWDAGVWSGVF